MWRGQVQLQLSQKLIGGLKYGTRSGCIVKNQWRSCSTLPSSSSDPQQPTEVQDVLKALVEGLDTGNGGQREVQDAASRAAELFQNHSQVFSSNPELFAYYLRLCSYQDAVTFAIPEMKKMGVSIEAPHYVAMARSIRRSPFGGEQEKEKVFQLFGAAKKNGCLSVPLFEEVFSTCAFIGATEKIYDLWLEELETWITDEEKKAKSMLPLSERLGVKMVSWCEKGQDVKRAMRVWGMLRRQRLKSTVPLCTALLQVTKRMKDRDGGFQKLVLTTIQKEVSVDEFLAASQKDLRRLMSCVPPETCVSILHLLEEKGSSNGKKSNESKKSHKIPKQLWIQLLSQFTKYSYVSEAEGLMQFLLSPHAELSEMERSRVVKTMMKMYAFRLSPPDFDSCNAVFQKYVASPEDDQQALEIEPEHYDILIAAAKRDEDCLRNLYLEACSQGIVLSENTHRILFSVGSNDIQNLSDRLPTPYEPSEFDEMLQIPADIDAHYVRERSQQLRGKDVVSSTENI